MQIAERYCKSKGVEKAEFDDMFSESDFEDCETESEIKQEVDFILTELAGNVEFDEDDDGN